MQLFYDKIIIICLILTPRTTIVVEHEYVFKMIFAVNRIDQNLANNLYLNDNTLLFSRLYCSWCVFIGDFLMKNVDIAKGITQEADARKLDSHAWAVQCYLENSVPENYHIIDVNDILPSAKACI